MFFFADEHHDILMAYLAPKFSGFGRSHCQDALSDPAVQAEIRKVAQENFQRCHGKFEHFGGLQDLLGIERRLELVVFCFFGGLVILPWSFMGDFDLYGFATFYRYGWVNRRNSSVNRHVCLGVPKGLSSHCFIESMMCIPVSIRDTPISIDVYIYIENYIDYIILIHVMCISVCDIPITMSMHPL